jgi:hypothetical protein
MTVKIEKDVKFDVNKMEEVIKYFIWADGKCIHMVNTEDEAKDFISKLRTSYVRPTTEIIHEEEI